MAQSAIATEDGGRLKTFAPQPRMEVVAAESGWGRHERAEKLIGRMAFLGFIANTHHDNPVQDSLSLSRQFSVEAHARAIDSCTELEDLRKVAKSLLKAWQLQAMFTEMYGAQALGITRP